MAVNVLYNVYLPPWMVQFLEPNSGIHHNQVTFFNEGRRNSLSGKMMCELLKCVETLEQWEDGAGLVLTGDLRENFFCAGADLKVTKRIQLSLFTHLQVAFPQHCTHACCRIC